ncbi:hypothetical protein [Pseudomonas sp. BN515]|uniref:hypothetical protein n=1 Tax=Pseudomonas sp. BN515 TaxID=2567892 RepID=UPI002458C630|nr:hypothetical protein [Pseudomonas sp. BN515]MDH4869324.1 hypothetical protein [Pseudomonas sp. BN515]
MVDARFLIFDKRTVQEDGFSIDKETGEILGKYYSEIPIFPDEGFPSVAPEECGSVDEWKAYLKSHVDLRKFPKPTIGNLRSAQDLALGMHFRKEGDYRISEPMMKLLVKLLGLVQYRNLIIDSRSGLAKSLGVSPSNLMKTLEILSGKGLIRCSTSSNSQMRVGEIKVAIAPFLIFRGYDRQQEAATEVWYKPDGKAIVDALVQEALFNLEQYQRHRQEAA